VFYGISICARFFYYEGKIEKTLSYNILSGSLEPSTVFRLKGETEMKELYEGFEKLVRDPSLLNQLKELSGSSEEYPAAPGGLRAYWDTKCMHNGWKLQKNYYFGHYRIVDEYNVKKVCCAESDMLTALEKFAVLN
jgi:hypothetical protein